MKTLDAGQLRHRISLQQKTVTQDPNSGSAVETWTEVAKLWASVEPVSAREFSQAQAMQSKVTTRIKIRYRPGVTATMRAVHRGAIYNIEGVLADPHSGLDWLTLACSTGTNDG